LAIKSLRYETRLLILLSLANGVVALDRLTASFLSPYLVADLGLNNTQLGLMSAALSIAVAASSVLLGRVADRTGRRRLILLSATVLFSLFSGLSGVAAGFGALLLARLLLGAAEGPMVPLSQAIMAEESHPSRRGFNMGVMQMTGAFLIGGMAGPVIATAVADAYGWRAAFFLSALPGLALALGLFFVMRPDAPRPPRRSEDVPAVPLWAAIRTLWRVRNVRLSVLIAGLFSAWLMIQNVFLPVYLTQVKGLAPATMGWVIGMGGLAGVAGGVTLPGLSDRIGRRPVITVACFLGVAAPIAVLLLPPDPVMLGVAILFGWIVLGIAPLYCGVIPSESAPAGLVTTAIGLCMGSGELIGGVIGPSVAGRAADGFGLAAPLWICVGLAFVTGLLCLLLEESAPARLPAADPLQGLSSTITP
jgi:MFS family permease